MPTEEMLQWYHHPVYNRYWKQFWMIKDWINHCKKSEQVARHRAFHETTQISQNKHCCACKHDHHICHHSSHVHSEQNEHCVHSPCVCPHHEYAMRSSHACLKHHEHGVRSFCKCPKHRECAEYSIGAYPKHREYDLRAPQDQPEISSNQTFQHPLKKRKTKKSSMVESFHGNVESENSDSELDFVITDEWIQIITESKKFREERDALKKQREQEAEREQVDGSSTSKLSSKAKQVRKQAEMKKMYGIAAEKIRKLETAMQLSFDRLCDANKPHEWPVLPLKM